MTAQTPAEVLVAFLLARIAENGLARQLAVVRAAAEALAAEAEGRYVIPGVDVTRRAQQIAELARVIPPGDVLGDAVEAVLIADARLTEPIPMALAAALDNLRRCRYGERPIPPGAGQRDPR